MLMSWHYRTSIFEWGRPPQSQKQLGCGCLKRPNGHKREVRRRDASNVGGRKQGFAISIALGEDVEFNIKWADVSAPVEYALTKCTFFSEVPEGMKQIKLMTRTQRVNT